MASIHEPVRSRATWPIPAVDSALAVISLATAGIHFSVMGEHFQEYVAFGVFFSAVAWFQSLWALGVVVSPSRPVLLAGAIVNALVVLVWLVSRTIGLPIGPEAGVAEPAAFLDVLSTVLELVLVAAIAALLLRGRPVDAGPARARRGLVLVGGMALTLALLTTVAVAVAADEPHGNGDEDAAGSAPSEPGLVVVDLGSGRSLQALVEGSAGTTQIHLTFFDAEGDALHVHDLSVEAVSSTDEEESIAVEPFGPGHYAATTDLAAGDYELHLDGAAQDGTGIDAHVDVTIP